MQGQATQGQPDKQAAEAMMPRIRIDGAEYDTAQFSDEGKALVMRLTFVQKRIQELSNQQALLMKAKNAYVFDIKSEILQDKSGLDLSDLLSDDWTLE